MSVLNKDYVLVLNALYIPIGVTTIKKALTAMNSSSDGENLAAQALDLTYPLAKGTLDFLHPTFQALHWDDWVPCPIRDFDIPIHTPRLVIRAPIVILAKNYSKIPMKEIPISKRAVYDHYKGKCIWTGRTLSFSESSLEHMVCKSHNGEKSWDNIALADYRLNAERGNTPVSEWKYKAKYKLHKPIAKTPESMITVDRPEWEYFLFKRK